MKALLTSLKLLLLAEAATGFVRSASAQWYDGALVHLWSYGDGGNQQRVFQIPRANRCGEEPFVTALP